MRRFRCVTRSLDTIRMMMIFWILLSRSGTVQFRSTTLTFVDNVTRRTSGSDTRLSYYEEDCPRNTGPGALASVEGRRPQRVQHTAHSQGTRQQNPHQPITPRCNPPGGLCRLWTPRWLLGTDVFATRRIYSTRLSDLQKRSCCFITTRGCRREWR